MPSDHVNPPSRTQSGAAPALSLTDLEYHARGWELDGEVQMLSRSYVARRADVTGKLLWFLRREGLEQCGPHEMRAFFAYLRRSHEDPGGRWDNEHERDPLRPSSIRMYHAMLRAFWGFVVAEGALEVSPMATLKSPVAHPDQIQPFSPEQQRALVDAARKSRHRERNVALVLFLLDTGCRVSECCALVYEDLSFAERSCRVRGKGDKERVVCYGAETARALWAALRNHSREPTAPLWLSRSGKNAGGPLTRFGLQIIIEELGKAASIQGVRCSPHTLRHTFAVNYLRAGGDAFALQVLLGHSNPSITARYVNYARADIQEQHRRLSPLDRVLGKRDGR